MKNNITAFVAAGAAPTTQTESEPSQPVFFTIPSITDLRPRKFSLANWSDLQLLLATVFACFSIGPFAGILYGIWLFDTLPSITNTWNCVAISFLGITGFIYMYWNNKNPPELKRQRKEQARKCKFFLKELSETWFPCTCRTQFPPISGEYHPGYEPKVRVTVKIPTGINIAGELMWETCEESIPFSELGKWFDSRRVGQYQLIKFPDVSLQGKTIRYDKTWLLE